MSVLISAFMEGKRGGALSVSVAIVIGLVLGIVTWWITGKIFEMTVTRFQLHEAKLTPIRYVLSYSLIVAVIGIAVFAVIAAEWATKYIMRFL